MPETPSHHSFQANAEQTRAEQRSAPHRSAARPSVTTADPAASRLQSDRTEAGARTRCLCAVRHTAHTSVCDNRGHRFFVRRLRNIPTHTQTRAHTGAAPSSTSQPRLSTLLPPLCTSPPGPRSFVSDLRATFRIAHSRQSTARALPSCNISSTPAQGSLLVLPTVSATPPSLIHLPDQGRAIPPSTAVG